MQHVTCQAAGFFGATVTGGRRGTVDLIAELGHAGGLMPNLILDSGIVAFLNDTTESTGSQYGFIQLGTGRALASPSQTALENRTHGGGSGSKITGKTKGYDIPQEYGWTRASHTFTAGQATGTFTEIGSAPAATGPCFSRARIEDASGRPAALTVLADEELRLVYELRTWWARPAPHLVQWEDGGTQSTTVSYPVPLNVDRGNAGSPQNAYLTITGATAMWGAPIASGTSRTFTARFNEPDGVPSIASIATTSGVNNFVPASQLCAFSPAVAKSDEQRMDFRFSVSFQRRP